MLNEAKLAMRIPHTRGDEPVQLMHATGYTNVYPTRVGMNRCLKSRSMICSVYTPHAWG